MKTRALVSTILLASLWFTCPAHAFLAWTIGNGGQTVVCRDTEGKPISRQVFDLYEGSILYGFKYPADSVTASLDPIELAKSYARKIDRARGDFQNDPPASGDDSIEGRIQFVSKNMTLFPPGVGLQFTEDTNEFIVFPLNCSLEQTINFRDSDFIYVDSDVWGPLSVQNKAALYLHEALYWYLRETGVEHDSRRTRRAVSYLMSGGELVPRTQLAVPGIKNVQYCRSTNRSIDEDWATRLIAYRNPADGKFIAQFMQLGGFRMLTQSYITGDVLGGIAELPIDPSQTGTHGLVGRLQSLLDKDGKVMLTWGDGKIHIESTMQPSNIIKDDLECVPWPIN